MAKKRYDTTIELTWSGETRVDMFLGKEVVVSSANETWSGTEALWTDDIINIVKYLLYGGSRGGLKKQWDEWNAWDNINEKNKQKIVKVLVYLDTGVKVESKIDVNKYKLTVEDINLLEKAYEKHIFTVKNVKIKKI